MIKIQLFLGLLILSISSNNLIVASSGVGTSKDTKSKKRQRELDSLSVQAATVQSAACSSKVKDEPLEIELKFKISEPLLQKFKQQLGNPSQQVHMSEIYLLGKDIQPMYKDGYNKMPQYLRLRTTNKGSFVTLKKRTEQSVTEYETALEDMGMMDSIFKSLGYGATEQDRVRLEKQRTKYNVKFGNDDIEVVFDTFSSPEHMQKMGEFVETELKSKALSYEDGIERLKRFLLSHGITHIDKYPPYIEQAINQNAGNRKEQINLAESQNKKSKKIN